MSIFEEEQEERSDSFLRSRADMRRCYRNMHFCKHEEQFQRIRSSTGEASQTSEMTSGTTSSVTEPVITEPEPIQTLPAESEDTSEPETRPDDPTADMVVTSAASLIGTDFVDGGETPEQGFDNSGFIYYVLRENGYITCPRGVSQAVGDGTGDKLRGASQGRSGVFL